MGRVWTISNPYRSTNDPSCGLTTYTSDPLGRTTSVTNPDTTASTTTYAGLSTTVTDAAGNTRTLVSDALGHLISVRRALPVGERNQDPSLGDLRVAANHIALLIR